MHTPSPLSSTKPIVIVRAINFELDDTLRSSTAEKAIRLLRYSDRIQHICLELENDSAPSEAPHYTAKGKVDFGGPALLASVMGQDAAQALDYLIDQLEHQLRRQQYPRGTLTRTPPPPALRGRN